VKPEQLVQAQFDAARVEWGKEKAVFQAEILSLTERVVGKAIKATLPVLRKATEVVKAVAPAPSPDPSKSKAAKKTAKKAPRKR